MHVQLLLPSFLIWFIAIAPTLLNLLMAIEALSLSRIKNQRNNQMSKYQLQGILVHRYWIIHTCMVWQVELSQAAKQQRMTGNSSLLMGI
jgi:hypothetical protein